MQNIANSISDGDADCLIVKTALNYVEKKKLVMVASDDTDILNLLLHHMKDIAGTVYFSTDRKEPLKKGDNGEKKKAQRKKKPVPMWWSIKALLRKEDLMDVPVLLAHG
jgi:hypothetical protein